MNLVTLDGETLSYEAYSAQIQAMPLLATTRLIIIENIFSNPNKETLEKIKNSLDKVSKSSVVVFVQRGMPDKRTGLFKALNKPKISETFEDLTESSWRKLANDLFYENSSKAENEAIDLLYEYVGNDLWRLSEEVKKLSCYSSKKITSSDVENMVAKSINANIFALTDQLANSNKKIILKDLQDLLDSGEPPLKILSMIGYQLRSLCQVKDALIKSPNQFAVSKMTSLAPFQVGKMIPTAKRLTWAELSAMYDLLCNFDEIIKTGKMEGKEALKELVLNI